MIRVRFHRLAGNDLRQAHRWYGARNHNVAKRFLMAVDAAVRRIESDPTSLPIELHEIRWIRIARFPYRLFFECLTTDEILILAVAHASRRSRYWRHRR